MRNRFVRLTLSAVLVCGGLTGCQQSGGKSVTRESKKPEDPTAWTGAELARDDSAPTQARPKSSRLQGGWSDEAKSIENSLGVGR